ncbi:MAG: hypothetical protein ACLVJ6_07125 [Merdibacter sp.]
MSAPEASGVAAEPFSALFRLLIRESIDFMSIRAYDTQSFICRPDGITTGERIRSLISQNQPEWAVQKENREGVRQEAGRFQARRRNGIP